MSLFSASTSLLPFPNVANANKSTILSALGIPDSDTNYNDDMNNKSNLDNYNKYEISNLQRWAVVGTLMPIVIACTTSYG